MKHPKSKVAWNPGDYAANSVVQQKWAQELIAKLDLEGSEWILDVGCGDGKITAELARAQKQGQVVGVDASRQMIQFAQKKFTPREFPNLKFHVMDARKLRFEQEFDVLFSNAALHWVDDHPAFLQGAAQALKTGGRLVISCGGKGNAQDVFVALRSVMRRERWRQFFRKLEKPYFFYAPADYEKWLAQYGFKAETVKLAPKDATYPGWDGLATWLRTTWLPYTQRVPESSREEFIAQVTDKYVEKHPPDADGNVVVRMVRLEIEAVRVAG